MKTDLGSSSVHLTSSLCMLTGSAYVERLPLRLLLVHQASNYLNSKSQALLATCRR